MKRMMIMEHKEITWNHVQGESYGTMTCSERKWINKMRKLNQLYPDQVMIKHVNKDESIVVQTPANWFTIRPPKKTSEKAKLAASERMKKYHEERKNQTASDEEDSIDEDDIVDEEDDETEDDT